MVCASPATVWPTAARRSASSFPCSSRLISRRSSMNAACPSGFPCLSRLTAEKRTGISWPAADRSDGFFLTRASRPCLAAAKKSGGSMSEAVGRGGRLAAQSSTAHERGVHDSNVAGRVQCQNAGRCITDQAFVEVVRFSARFELVDLGDVGRHFDDVRDAASASGKAPKP